MNDKRLLIALLAIPVLLGACNESTKMSSSWTVALHANFIRPDRTEFHFNDAEGGSMQFTVTSQDTPWRIENVPDWISVSPTSGTTTSTVTVTVGKYAWATPRMGIFTLSSGSADWDYSRQMNVIQDGAEAYADISKLDFSFDGAAHSESVRATSNFDWQFSDHGNKWISISRTGDEMTLSVTPNDTKEVRTGQVDIVFNSTVLATVTVSQAAAEVNLKADPLNYEIGAGTYTLSITSQAPWHVVNNFSSWIDVSPASGGEGTTEVKVSVTPNGNDGERNGYIYFNFSNSGLQIAEIPIHQDGTILELTEGADFMQNLSSLGGNFSIHLHSNTNWQISSYPEFLTISPTSGSGDTVLSISLPENPTFDGKGDWMYIVRPETGYTVSYWVGQRSRSLRLGETWLQCNDLAQVLYVDVETEGPWSLTPMETATFFSASPLSSKGNGRISLDVQENKDFGSRQGQVDFSLLGIAGYDNGVATMANIYVNQQGWQDKYQEVGQDIQILAKGGTMVVDISTNDGWTAAFASSPGWIKIDGTASGKGAGSFTVVCNENQTVDARSVKVKVTFEHLDPVVFTITQLGKAIRLSCDALYFFDKGGSITVSVDADGKYSVARASGDWFTVTAGENNTFTVTASASPNGAERTGSIVLTLTDLKSGSYKLTVPVFQTSAAGFTRDGWQEDRDLNLGTGSGFSIKVTGFSTDRNWNAGRYVTVGGEGYGDDENWN